MNWPPLLDSASLPRRIVVRDVLLTLLAWALLLYSLRDLLWMATYWALAALDIDSAHRWKPGELWRDTLPFLNAVGLLVLWLAVFSIARWRLLTNRARNSRAPAPLDAGAHAEAFGLSPDTLERVRAARIATLQTPDPTDNKR